MNKNILQPSDKYAVNNLTLTVNSVTPDDSGLYECSTTVNSVPYVIWQSITIQPYPDIQMTLSKVVKCDNMAIPLQCCFQGMYKGNWNGTCTSKASVTTGCISCDYEINKQTCQSNGQVIPIICQLTPLSGSTTQSFLKSINIEVKNKEFSCSDNVFGAGDSQAISITNCTGDMVGNQTAKCNSSGRWDIIENNCIPRIFQTLINDAKILQLEDIPQFMTNLSSATVGTQNITGSSATIVTIVEILNTISNLSSTVLINQPIMMVSKFT
ncbi:hypothetical protein AMELA_G00153270 [Ameiurus melas]|uniref:Uncharacterized protein n=1 Tax=Ameiurus melas TaxID=219545 RepID=A0A7J6AIW4_AMEME|nr:hypothetical protein AMELA_G00153270 [Ameiurus melas]